MSCFILLLLFYWLLLLCGGFEVVGVFCFLLGGFWGCSFFSFSFFVFFVVVVVIVRLDYFVCVCVVRV